ncbi:MAG TPA: TolC family protein [Longimicrobiales bacterium]|nr:TolC family protein [Longimicrobiales bacterium]
MTKTMRIRIMARPMVVLTALVVSTGLEAQQAPPTMSLDEAVQLARRYSPEYQQQVNDEAVADWNVRAAYGSLLPTLSVGGGIDWRGGGTPRVGQLSGEELGLSRTPDYLFSSYSIGLGWSVSGGTFFRMAQERAAREATMARIEAAAYTLETGITRQYLAALRARDAVRIAERELASTDEALKLAQARVDAGAAPRMDAAQAEVARGRSEVALLQAQAAEENAKLRLLEAIGLDLDQTVDLTTELAIFEPTWTLEDLTQTAMQNHPQLVAARAAESSGRAAARAARMSYLPTISIGGGWSGYTEHSRDEAYLLGRAQSSAENRIDSCMRTNDLYSRLANPLPPQDCALFALTDADRAAILSSNNLFPFDFTKQPPSFGLNVSMPIFTGFARQAQVQQASAAAEDAKHQRRQEELGRKATVATSYLAVKTAYRAVAIEERNLVAAAEQLELARERYRLGAGSILELTQAQATMARADQAHLEALYSFHENLAELESAVGRPLR